MQAGGTGGFGEGLFPGAAAELAAVPGWHDAKWHWDVPVSPGLLGACVCMGMPSCGCLQPQRSPGGCSRRSPGDLSSQYMWYGRGLLHQPRPRWLTLNCFKLFDFTRRLSKHSELLIRCRGAESITLQARRGKYLLGCTATRWGQNELREAGTASLLPPGQPGPSSHGDVMG